MKTLVIIGSAPFVSDDLARIPDIESCDHMAVGLSSTDKYSGRIDYIANNHPENNIKIREIMKQRGSSDYKIIGPAQTEGVDIVEPYRPPTGSSSITGAFAAIRMGYRKIILAGCPLIGNAPAGNTYEEFRQGWDHHKLELIGIVKSMSGWTREFLGEPTPSWISSANRYHIKNSIPEVRHTLTRWDYIIALANKYEWKTGAELGIWYGKTLFNLLDRLPDLHMTAVDAWVKEITSPHHQNADENYRTVHKRLQYYGKRVSMLDMTTLEASRLVADSSLDFVFIDAAHDYNSVAEDIRMWHSKVKPGGFLIGHDQDWPTVDAAVLDTIGPAYIYNAGGDFMWAWRMP